MKEFFDKYGGGHEPYHAIEIMLQKLYGIKEKVERGESNITPDLKQLSDMLDDFAKHTQGQTFSPRKYQDYHPRREGGGMHNEYNPYRTTGTIGYDWYPNVYPMYPFFEREDRRYVEPRYR